MNKTSTGVPWGVYCMSIGFILIGLYELKKWLKEPKRPDTPQDTLYKWAGFLPPFAALTAGIGSLIISIYMDCTGNHG